MHSWIKCSGGKDKKERRNLKNHQFYSFGTSTAAQRVGAFVGTSEVAEIQSSFWPH